MRKYEMKYQGLLFDCMTQLLKTVNSMLTPTLSRMVNGLLVEWVYT